MRIFVFLVIFILQFPLNLSAFPQLINGKLMIAVAGGSSKFMTAIEGKLLKTDFAQPVERKQLNKLLKESNLEQSGLVKDGPKIGKTLGAYYIVLFDNHKSTSFKLVQVETTRILGAWESYTEKNVSELLNILEVEASLIQLINLKSPNKKTEIELMEVFSNAELENEGVKFGEPIEIEYTITSKIKEVYVTILVYTMDGAIVQVFPNKYQSDNRVPSNTELKFPPENAPGKYKLLAAPPEGYDKIVVIASEKPVVLPQKERVSLGKNGMYQGIVGGSWKGTKGVRLSLQKVGGNYDVRQLTLNIREK
ncbi:MAG: DUF4384 domain-containing protein [Leptospiraceae bacterium]|nr:DUF4384 domain-containing protein [Leptospiraceae bacterium]